MNESARGGPVNIVGAGPTGSLLALFQALFQGFVGLKNGDLPFDILFNVNHNNF